ncbi:MAG: hypothetical protein OHK0039_21730 [Bacteroidia bacterium]
MKLSDDAKRLQAIFDSAIDGIITIDEQGIIERVNPAAAKLFEYRPDELIGQNVSMLMPHPYRRDHDSYLHRYHETGQAHIIGVGREVIGLRKNGTTFPFRLAISEARLGENGRRIYTGFVHDLSKEKEAEERLRRYAAELERSNHELENFAYISSHDLQEPLRKIQAFGSRLESLEQDKLSDKGRDYLARLLNASVRMQNLINDLLSFSRVSTRAQAFVAVDLNTTLREVCSDLEILIVETQAHIVCEPLPTIEADPTQMRQLFQNLLTNAIKFRKEDTLPSIHIRATDQPVNNWVHAPHAEISVRDNGIGFEEKYLDRIFDIFQRLEGRRYEGSGIGLAICRKIASRHGGYITARSTPGEGADFLVKLPYRQVPSPE